MSTVGITGSELSAVRVSSESNTAGLSIGNGMTRFTGVNLGVVTPVSDISIGDGVGNARWVQWQVGVSGTASHIA